MIVISRFSVPEDDGAAFAARAEAALAVLSPHPGYRRGSLCRAVDDPTRWVLVTEWDGVGPYRRALSAYGVKVAATPLLAESVDEPSAYEVLLDDGGRRPSDRASR
ncbi:MAG: antibiotic biosynthesis monooxygenase [Pseudonocardiales bacterium]